MREVNIGMVHWVLVLFFLLVTYDDAYAYVDPGVGGMFYQILVLIAGAIAAYFAILRRYIRKLFTRNKAKDGETK